MLRRQEMALGNSGDTVELIDAMGTVVDRVKYERAAEGQEIVVGSADSGGSDDDHS